MGKPNKSFAEEGLEAIQADSNQAESNVKDTVNDDSNFDFDSLSQAGGLEPVSFYYRFAPPKKPSKYPFQILSKGDTIKGTYVKAFSNGTKDAKGNDKLTHLIRNTDGKLVGLPSAGGLDRDLAVVLPGRIKVEYHGMAEIKKGQWKGKDSHQFAVFAENKKQ